MRLTNAQKIVAREELLEMLKNAPHGLSTEQLRGTRSFHGTRTLSATQIARFLRESGQAKGRLAGSGMRTFTHWTFNTAIPENAGEIIGGQLLEILDSKPGSLNSPEHLRACLTVLTRAKEWHVAITVAKAA
jgi:hypothetical protein